MLSDFDHGPTRAIRGRSADFVFSDAEYIDFSILPSGSGNPVVTYGKRKPSRQTESDITEAKRLGNQASDRFVEFAKWVQACHVAVAETTYDSVKEQTAAELEVIRARDIAIAGLVHRADLGIAYVDDAEAVFELQQVMSGGYFNELPPVEQSVPTT